MRPLIGIFLTLATVLAFAFQSHSSSYNPNSENFTSAEVKYDSTRDGKYKSYNDSGRLIFVGRYKNGLRHGTFKEYDATGLLVRKTRYRHGKMKWMQVYRNGKIIEYIDKDGNIRKAKNCGC